MKGTSKKETESKAGKKAEGIDATGKHEYL